MVERTQALVDAQALRIDEQARILLSRYDDDTLHRAVSYLYTKETRSTWALEREKPTPQRAERFVLALRHAARVEQLNEQEFVSLQNVVVGPTYADRAYREVQNHVGSGYVGRGVVEFVCPRPEDVPSLMKGLIACGERMSRAGVDPVIAAAVLSFGFVFIHPFRDGNGRLHRWLIHYDQNDNGSLAVHGETALHYRYFDCTPMAEALYRWTAETVRTELKSELDFLVRYRATRAEMDEVVDMPEKEASLFIKLVVDNHGTLSKAKRAKFSELDDALVTRLEEVVRRNMLAEEP